MKAKAIHFILLCLLIAYLFSANAIYTTFFLRNGKPVPGNILLPPETKHIQFKLYPAEQVYYDGQYLYALSGSVLHETLPPEAYTIKIILHSASDDLIFNVDGTADNDFMVQHSDYDMDMEYQFRMLFSKNVLKFKSYQIGILLEDLHGTPIDYQRTENYIKRTPSTIHYIPEHSD